MHTYTDNMCFSAAWSSPSKMASRRAQVCQHVNDSDSKYLIKGLLCLWVRQHTMLEDPSAPARLQSPINKTGLGPSQCSNFLHNSLPALPGHKLQTPAHMIGIAKHRRSVCNKEAIISEHTEFGTVPRANCCLIFM